jgi:SMODS-associated and fused to various effectors sensor domain
MLTGSLRQATAFTVGATLRKVTNVNLAVLQGDQLWTTDTDYTEPTTPTVTEHPLGQGDEIAIAVAVATHLTNDVLTFLRACQVPVDRLVVMQPPGGAKDNSIPTPAAAVALAVGLRDQARRAVKDPRRVHLFLAGPMGLSLLLGHRWNRVAPTTVYEEVRGKHQYHRAFEVSA